MLVSVILLAGCAATPTVKSVAGTYEIKHDDGDTRRVVLLKNGIVESYTNGKKDEEGKWKITKEGELHASDSDGDIVVLRINKDGSLTAIAEITKDGKREGVPKDEQITVRKIK